jgi:hypothetical protein
MFSYIYICIQNIVKYINDLFLINTYPYYIKIINNNNVNKFKTAIIKEDKELIKQFIKDGYHKNYYYNNENLILNYAMDNEKWNVTETILDEFGVYKE